MGKTGNERSGIIAAGNWIIDHLKMIDKYPEQDSLSNISSEYVSNGGSPYNILKNLSKLGASFSLKGIGVVGNDVYAHQIKMDCAHSGIDSSMLRILPDALTSYTDVMTVKSTGRRTFFHQRGANALLDVEHFDFTTANEKIFHLGYLLLLDALDKIYDDGTSGASQVLHKACDAGIITSADIVSEDSDRFSKVILPSLPYIHYLFLNEFEASRFTGIDLVGDEPDYESLNEAATTILDNGVREWVIIHFKNGVFAKRSTGEILTHGAIELPTEMVVSSVGAGDALAAGVLYGIHESWNMTKALRLGVCCAASCLQQPSCSGGILTYKDCMKLWYTYSSGR